MQIETTEFRRGTAGYRSGLIVLVLYAAVFVWLSYDLMTRIWSWRTRMAAGNVAVLTFFEVSRSMVTAGAILLLAWMATRRTEPRWRPLAYAIGFAAIWHTKAFVFEGFPGPRQEAVALWLRSHDVPQQLLVFVFASPAWALACAAAAALRHAVVFPTPLQPSHIDLPAGADRAGMMRSTGVAGMDIGAMFRTLTRWLLVHGWLRTKPVALLTVLWILGFQLAGGAPLATVAGAVLLAVTAGVIVTAQRGALAATEDEAVRHTSFWLTRGLYTGAAMFAGSALASALLQGPVSFIGVALLGLAPAAALACCWIAVTTAPAPVQTRATPAP